MLWKTQRTKKKVFFSFFKEVGFITEVTIAPLYHKSRTDSVWDTVLSSKCLLWSGSCILYLDSPDWSWLYNMLTILGQGSLSH